MAAPAAIAEVTYRDTAELEAECALVADAPFAQTFMTACSPGIVASAMQNRHYPSMEEYVRAVAAALRTEYQAIVDRGLLLQIDAPDLALERHTLFGTAPAVGVPRRGSSWWSTPSTARSEGIDPAQVRLHVCWGNYEGPHDHDVPFEEIQPLLYEANVGALVISMANARHAHEVRCFERRPLPDGMALVAGVIDTTSNYVEHPEVVAERIERAAAAVGDPRRIIAGTDCGFDTTAGIGDVAPEPRVGEAARAAGRGRPGVGAPVLTARLSRRRTACPSLARSSSARLNAASASRQSALDQRHQPGRGHPGLGEVAGGDGIGRQAVTGRFELAPLALADRTGGGHVAEAVDGSIELGHPGDLRSWLWSSSVIGGTPARHRTSASLWATRG